MISFPLFLASPLARHPSLLVRKVADRLGLRRERLREIPTPVREVSYPGGWRDALIRGAGIGPNVNVDPTPRSFGHVFGRDFDETLLLRLCHHGPGPSDDVLSQDIKLIWDYSRGHALWPNALLGRIDDNASFVRRWLTAAGDRNGPAWRCAMDIAIRATNWVFSDVIAAGKMGQRFENGAWAAWLWRHGDAIWHRLEARINSSNHYLANLLGLAVLGSIFPNDSAARRWREFARSEFPKALLAQTRPDGGLNEASLRYHAFVTEMALLTRLALGSAFPEPAERRVRQMCQIIADFRDADGDVFPLGDDDSGRVLTLDDIDDAGRVDALLRLAEAQMAGEFEPTPEAVYADSGWWVRRAGEFALVFEFGGVGLNGEGAHAHNDDFSFCLEWKEHPVIVDPGTYLYTSDPAARNRFRSVRAHNTICIDEQEQRPLGESLFRLRGSDNAAAITASRPTGRTFRRATGTGLVHQRDIDLNANCLTIQDFLEGGGQHRIEWRFHLHPAVEAQPVATGWDLHLPGRGKLRLEMAGEGLQMELQAAQFSCGYGQVTPTKVCVAKAARHAFPPNEPNGQKWTLRTTD